MAVRSEYRETKTGDLYEILYQRDEDGVYHIHAERHPRNRYDESVAACHLHRDGELCVDHAKFEPRTLDQAKACAYLWMEGYSQYVRSGRFPDTGGDVHV